MAGCLIATKHQAQDALVARMKRLKTWTDSTAVKLTSHRRDEMHHIFWKFTVTRGNDEATWEVSESGAITSV